MSLLANYMANIYFQQRAISTCRGLFLLTEYYFNLLTEGYLSEGYLRINIPRSLRIIQARFNQPYNYLLYRMILPMLICSHLTRFYQCLKNELFRRHPLQDYQTAICCCYRIIRQQFVVVMKGFVNIDQCANLFMNILIKITFLI